MRRTTRLAAAGLALTGLLAAGCSAPAGPDDPSPAPPVTALPSVDAAADAAALATVRLTAEPGEEPVLTFAPPITVTGPIARVVDPGAGDEVIPVNSAVVVDVVTVDGSDGTERGTTYGGSPQILMTDEAHMPMALLELLVGARTGTRVLLAGPVTEDETTLWVFEVRSVLDVPVQAEGSTVEPGPGLPLVGYADSGTTEARMPMIVPAQGAPPDELVVRPLIVGDGATVTAGSSLIVQVVGALWDGTQVENSWEEGAGLPVVLSGTNRGWREGLLGQTIGSQVMLVVPPDWAWGDEGRGDLVPAGSTLVYVIDILAGI